MLKRFMVTCCVARQLQMNRYAHSTGGSDGKSLAVNRSEEKEGNRIGCQMLTTYLHGFILAFF